MGGLPNPSVSGLLCDLFIEHHLELNIPPSVHGDTKYGGTAWCLPWWVISGRWGEAQCYRGGMFVEHSVLIGTETFPLFYFTDHKMPIWRVEKICEVNSSQSG